MTRPPTLTNGSEAPAVPSRSVLVTGATGYVGSALAGLLVSRGHRVKALVRDGSQARIPAGVEAIPGSALETREIANALEPGDTLVQLVGTPKPAPWKAAQFRAVDLRSGLAAITAAKERGAAQLVYVSVARPAPVMKAYVAVRAECEAAIGAAHLDATILRPWYVLGPGHRWPCVLVPLYVLLERIPRTRDSALRLGLVTLAQIVSTLVFAVENPVTGVRVLDTVAIRGHRGR